MSQFTEEWLMRSEIVITLWVIWLNECDSQRFGHIYWYKQTTVYCILYSNDVIQCIYTVPEVTVPRMLCKVKQSEGSAGIENREWSMGSIVE